MNIEKMKDAAKAAIEAAKEENPNKPAEVTPPVQNTEVPPTSEETVQNPSLIRRIVGSKYTKIFTGIVFIFIALAAIFGDPAEVENIRSLKVSSNPKVTWGEAIDGSFDKIKWKVESTKKDNIKKVYFSGIMKSKYNSDKPYVEAVFTYRDIPEAGKFRINIDHIEADGEAAIGVNNNDLFVALLTPYALEDAGGTTGKKK